MVISEIEPLPKTPMPLRGACWTFDVFDTVVARVVEKPIHIFSLMAEQSQILTDLPNFSQWRIDAEQAARLNKEGQHEVTLKEIYQNLRKLCDWSYEDMNKVMAAECSIEIASAVPLKDGLSLLDHARKNGVFGGFVSDMYLPTKTVEDILRQVGAWQEGDRLWVSAEHDQTKDARGLYELVRQDLDIEYSDWFHIGDNKKSDIGVPKKLGMNTMAMPPVNGNDAVVSSYINLTYNSLSSRLGAAVNRAIRSGYFYQLSEPQKVIWETSCNVTGPVLVCFVKWLLVQAKQAGVKQLLFLARDGQILFRIAEQLCADIVDGPELKYIAASRHAWHAASVDQLCEEDFVWIYANPDCLTAKKVFLRLGFSDEYRGLLEHCPISNQDEVLDTEKSQQLQKWLLSEGVSKVLSKISVRERVKIVSYLEQQGINDSFGLVDIGWYGNMQSSFERIVKGSAFEQKKLHGWYLGLFSKRKNLERSELSGFLFDVDQGIYVQEYTANVALFELLLSADHSGVIGFEEQEQVFPILRDESSWALQLDWGVTVQQHAILSFVSECKYSQLNDLNTDWMSYVAPMLKKLCINPTRHQSDVFGDWPAETEQVGELNAIPRLAPKLNWKTVASCYRNWAEPQNQELWRGGTKNRNSWALYWGFRMAKAVGRRLPC